MSKEVLKDKKFIEVTEVKLDSKYRVCLGSLYLKKLAEFFTFGEQKANYYKVYVNPVGQIILDPQATVPASEAWLFKNKKAAQMVQEGLEDAKKHRLVKAKEDYSQYLSDSE